MRSGQLGFPFTAVHIWLPGGGQEARKLLFAEPLARLFPVLLLNTCPLPAALALGSGALPAFLAHWAGSGDTEGQFPSPFVGV